MNFLRLFFILSISVLAVNCTTTSNNGVIETSEYVLDPGDASLSEKTLVKQASSADDEEEEQSEK